MNSTSPLLFIECKVDNSPIRFLIDTGSVVTTVPPRFASGIIPTNERLSAANGNPITTFGKTTMEIAIPKLRRKFTWKCFVADTTSPIIGADFLKHFNLSVNLHSSRLTDETTKFTMNCIQHPRSDSDIFPIAAVNPEIPPEVSILLNRYSNITQPFEAGKSIGHKTRHHIETHGPPVFCKPRAIHGEKLRAAKKEFETLLELGIVRHSNSPWSSPIHLVPKGDSWRVCGDYRRVNNVTERDSYPMTNVSSLNCILHGKKFFSKIDLVRGYNQIPMNEASIEKTAVNTPFGLFEYTRMPFGLCNASRTFQRFMNELLGHLDFVFAYIDDVLIFSDSEEEHIAHLETVLKIMSDNELHIGVEKCSFLKTEINFLSNRHSPVPKKN